jgi:hypothetical protein
LKTSETSEDLAEYHDELSSPNNSIRCQKDLKPEALEMKPLIPNLVGERKQVNAINSRLFNVN